MSRAKPCAGHGMSTEEARIYDARDRSRRNAPESSFKRVAP